MNPGGTLALDLPDEQRRDNKGVLEGKTAKIPHYDCDD